MSSSLIRMAHSKVNLHLAVGSPYPDGYHPIQSLFALTDLCDRLEINWSPSSSFSIDVVGLEAYCRKGEDTMSKAAKFWHEASGVPFSLQVHCIKNIPVQAGLGGGSSDAATLLLVLQELAGNARLVDSALASVALKVGSDVPFFIALHAAALVSGRGEVIEGVKARALSLLLIMPNSFSVSTAHAYRKLDEQRQVRKEFLPNRRILEIYEKDSQFWKGLLYNDFMSCVGNESFYDRLALVSRDFPGFGSLSGSGACWFFVSEDESNVRKLQDVVEAEFGDNLRCWVTELICNNPK